MKITFNFHVGHPAANTEHHVFRLSGWNGDTLKKEVDTGKGGDYLFME